MPASPTVLVRTALAAVGATVLAAGCTVSAARPDAGLPEPMTSVAIAADGALFASGQNFWGQLGDGGRQNSRALQPVKNIGGQGQLHAVAAIAGGARHSIAALQDGTVVAWGDNQYGQLGDGTTRSSTTPVRVRAPDGRPGYLTDAVAVAADSDFSMALLDNGTVVTWGKDTAGQRGIGSPVAPLTPTTVLTAKHRPLTGARAISADGRSEMALLANGTVVTWGDNRYGQLGDGTYQQRWLPVQVRGVYGAPLLTDVRGIAMGGQHAVAVLTDGRVMAWGSNSHGQLGDATLKRRPLPDAVAGVGGNGVLDQVVEVSAAELSSLALLRDGTAVGWGDNSTGELGTGLRTNFQPAPGFLVQQTSHDPLRHLAAVYAGEAYGVAVTDDGTLLTWGAGGKGQLAAHGLLLRLRAAPVPLPGGPSSYVVSVATGVRHLLVVIRSRR